MTETARQRPTHAQRAHRWLPLALRGFVTLLLLPAGILKFVDHSGEVAAFASYGIPVPEVIVLVVGVVELLAVLSIAIGAAGRLGALLLIPVMGTAMLTAGVLPSNAAVLVGCLGVAVLGTGDYSLWRPMDDRFAPEADRE